jgi:hypothetical protein
MMSSWREAMYKQVKQIEYCKTINTPRKVLELFENEFNNLVEPIIKEYPDVCKIQKSGENVKFSIGKNSLMLENDFESNSIKVIISRISSENGKPLHWGTIRFEEVTYMETLLPVINKGKKIFLDKSLIDELFKTTFEIPWLF